MQPTVPFTALWVLPFPDEPIASIGVRNMEQEATSYRLVVRSPGGVVERMVPQLAPGAVWSALVMLPEFGVDGDLLVLPIDPRQVDDQSAAVHAVVSRDVFNGRRGERAYLIREGVNGVADGCNPHHEGEEQTRHDHQP